MTIMKFALRRICSLLSSDTSHLKPCLSRRISSFLKFDSYPISNTIWHSREVNINDLGDPVKFFNKNPMFNSILLNKLVGRPKSKDGKKINPYLARISKMNPRMVSEIFAFALRSLAVITVENHRRGVPLGAAVELSNLRISYSSGKFVLLNILPKSNKWKGLTLQQRCDDWAAIRNLVRDLVDKVCGSDVSYPVDFAHWLEKLGEPQPPIFMILYHTMFLRLNGRFYYHVLLDQFCRKEPRGMNNSIMNDIDLRAMLREIGDLRELLDLGDLNEFLKCCIADGTPTAAAQYRQAGQSSNGPGQQGQAPPASGQQGQTATARGGQTQPLNPSNAPPQGQLATAQGGQSQPFNASNGPPRGQPSQAQGIPQGQASQDQGTPPGQASQGQGTPQGQASQGQGIPQGQASQSHSQGTPQGQASQGQGTPQGQASQGQGIPQGQASQSHSQGTPQEQASQSQDPNELIQRARLQDGRTMVAVHRNSPIHGCQKTCIGFSFIERWMVNRWAIIQIVYFTFMPFDHTVLELFCKYRIQHQLDMEGLFGETSRMWKFAINQHRYDVQKKI